MPVSLGDIAVRFLADTTSVDRAFDDLAGRGQDVGVRVGGQFTGGLSSALGGVGGILAGALSTALGTIGANVIGSLFEGITSAAREGAIGLNASLETTTLQFTTLMGNADQARAHVESLFDFAKATPFETGPIIEASRLMYTLGGAALATDDNLRLVGDAAASTGQQINEVGFWTARAYGNIQSGRPFGEAAERLQEMGILSGEARNRLEQMQESGAANTEVWAAFRAELERFNGAMSDQANTWTGLRSTFSDTIQTLSASIFAPFFEMAKDGLRSINAALGTPEVEAWAQRVATQLGEVIAWVRDLADRALPALLRAWEAIEPAVSAAARVLGSVGEVLGTLTTGAFAWGAGLIEQYAAGMSSGIGFVVDVLDGIGDTIAGWLEPHSPPRILPNIDDWGLEAARIYMAGWRDPSLFQSVEDFGSALSTVLQNLNGGENDAGVASRLFGGRAAFAAAVNELQATGQVSAQTFARIGAEAGDAGEQVSALAAQYLSLQAATQRLNAAQQERAAIAGEVEAAQTALLNAELRGGDTEGAQRVLAEARARRDAADERQQQAERDQKAAAAKVTAEQQMLNFQRQQIALLRQMAESQDRIARAAKKKPKESEEEKAAREAKKAQDEYEYSLLTTAEKIEWLKEKQDGIKQGSADWWKVQSQIRQLEQQAAREAQQAADEAERNAKKEQAEAEKTRKEKEALADAEWAHNFAVADSATKLQMLKDRQAELNPLQTEYWQNLTRIAQAEDTLARERDARAKRATTDAAKGQKERDALAKAEWDYNYSIADTAGKLKMLEDRQKTLNPKQVEYWQNLTKIAQVRERLAKETPEAEAEAAPEAAPESAGVGGGVNGTGKKNDAEPQERLQEKLKRIIEGLRKTISQFVTDGLPKLAADFAKWGDAATDWVIDALPKLGDNLGEYLDRIVQWLITNEPEFRKRLVPWTTALAQWILSAIPQLLVAGGKFWLNLLPWLNDIRIRINAMVIGWAFELTNWVTKSIPGLLSSLSTFGFTLLNWISKTAIDILNKMPGWAAAFTNWLIPATLRLLQGTSDLGIKVITWINETALSILNAMPRWAAAFLSWLSDPAKGLLIILPGELGKILTLFSAWVTGSINIVQNTAARIGLGIVDGIRKGITDAWAGFESWLNDQMAKIPEPIRKTLGISSPSRVLADLVGAPIVQGIGAGMAGEMPTLLSSAASMVGGLAGVPVPTLTAGVGLTGAAVGAGGAPMPAGAGGGPVVHFHERAFDGLILNGDGDISRFAQAIAAEIGRRQNR